MTHRRYETLYPVVYRQASRNRLWRGNSFAQGLSMYPKRPASILFLAILSAGNLPAAAMPLGDSQDAQRRCIDLYHQAQGEAQARLTAIGGDYAKGWTIPGMHYPTLSATVLRPFKDTAEGAIRQSCAGDARAATMDRLKGAMETAGRYDRPVAALSAR